MESIGNFKNSAKEETVETPENKEDINSWFLKLAEEHSARDFIYFLDGLIKTIGNKVGGLREKSFSPDGKLKLRGGPQIPENKIAFEKLQETTNSLELILSLKKSFENILSSESNVIRLQKELMKAKKGLKMGQSEMADKIGEIEKQLTESQELLLDKRKSAIEILGRTNFSGLERDTDGSAGIDKLTDEQILINDGENFESEQDRTLLRTMQELLNIMENQ